MVIPGPIWIPKSASSTVISENRIAIPYYRDYKVAHLTPCA